VPIQQLAAISNQNRKPTCQFNLWRRVK
jgi:hypothetical protein